VPVPLIDLRECVASFGLDASRWVEICQRTKGFFERTAYVRYDPAERLAVAQQYTRAAQILARGGRLEETGIPSLVSIDHALTASHR
jgi:hypothetical protein